MCQSPTIPRHYSVWPIKAQVGRCINNMMSVWVLWCVNCGLSLDVWCSWKISMTKQFVTTQGSVSNCCNTWGRPTRRQEVVRVPVCPGWPHTRYPWCKCELHLMSWFTHLSTIYQFLEAYTEWQLDILLEELQNQLWELCETKTLIITISRTLCRWGFTGKKVSLPSFCICQGTQPAIEHNQDDHANSKMLIGSISTQTSLYFLMKAISIKCHSGILMLLWGDHTWQWIFCLWQKVRFF